jgi:hypothetical protein
MGAEMIRMFLWGSMERDETGKKIFPVSAHIPQIQEHLRM